MYRDLVRRRDHERIYMRQYRHGQRRVGTLSPGVVRLLQTLYDNPGYTTSATLGKELGVSGQTIRNRVDRIRDEFGTEVIESARISHSTCGTCGHRASNHGGYRLSDAARAKLEGVLA